jgi:sugar phosphate isomerase/epimerase
MQVSSPPGRRKLSLAHLSLIASTPAEMIGIAGEAGFDLVDLRLSPATPSDVSYTSYERFTLCRQLIPLLKDADLRVWDVEIIRLNDRTDPHDHLPLMEAAALLGASRMKLVCDGGDHARAAHLLARLSELAVPFGLTLDLEYMVFSGVRSLGDAEHLVASAAQPNLRILVDALHWMRAGDTPDSLRNAKALGYVQLCDGPLQAPAGRDALIHEARTNRLAPGEGQFPLGTLLTAMPPNCVASLEVPLPPGRDPLVHARHLHSTARALADRHELETG